MVGGFLAVMPAEGAEASLVIAVVPAGGVEEALESFRDICEFHAAPKSTRYRALKAGRSGSAVVQGSSKRGPLVLTE